MTSGVIAILIVLLTLVLMVTQVFPLSVSAFLAAFAMAAFGLLKPSEILAQFGTGTFFCVPGMMVVGGAIFKTGLAHRLGRRILRGDRSERVFIAVLIAVVTLMSAFLSNTTCAAMFLPLAASAANNSGGRITRRNTYMCVGFAATLGGCATLVGSPSQHLLAQEILTSGGYEPMSFFHGMPATLLMMVVMILYFVTVGYTLENKVFNFPEKKEDPALTKEDQKLDYKMILSGIILVSAVVCIALGVLGSGEGALLGAVLLVATGCISLQTALDCISWPICLMLGGLFAMTRGFNNSGAGDMIVSFVVRAFGNETSPFLIFALTMLLAGLLTNVLDNIATQALLGPTYMALAIHYGIDVTTMLYALIFSCNLAYLTPVGTPSVALTLSGGYRFHDYFKVGMPLWLLGYLFTLFVIPLLYGFYA